MRTLIIYSSQTGFTKKYADWVGAGVQADAITLKEAKEKTSDYFVHYDGILYGGWILGGTIIGSDWFIDKFCNCTDKKLAIYGCGASPADNPDVASMLNRLSSDDKASSIQAFYCPGGLDYSKMKMPSRIMLKAFSTMLRKKKDATEDERNQGEIMMNSYDISDYEFAKIIIDYFNQN